VNFCGDIGQRGRAKVFGWYIIEDDRGYLRALVKLAPRAQVKLPSAVKLAWQVKFAFFQKRKMRPCGGSSTHPLARARASSLRTSARCALRFAQVGAAIASGALLSSGRYAKVGGNRVFVYSPAPAGASLRMHPRRACTRACALLVQALSLLRSEGACWFLGGI